jgi:hypothetical protein
MPKDFDPTRYRRVKIQDSMPEHARRYLRERKEVVPDWLDLEMSAPPRSRRARIAFWLEGADLRQLNRAAREFVADACNLQDGESMIAINRARNRVFVILRQHGMVFHASKHTGRLSTALTVGLLLREVYENV